ncbi:TPA: hypothetical protein DIS56_03105 [Candidatus Saccharibacteria bacterium]|nr:hypothetical protein [Candidatus Saccharibacteria bacterium]
MLSWSLNKWLTVAVIVAVVGAGWFFIFRDNPAVNQSKETPAISSVSFKYPEGWQTVKLTDADKIAGIILRLNKTNPESSLIIRAITGKLQKDVDFKALPGQIADTLAREAQNVTIISKDVARIGAYEAIVVRYKQVSKDNVNFENIMTVMPTLNQTFYLTARAKQADFSKIEGDSGKLSKDFADFVSKQQ